ncbi:transposase [Streptomyces cellulosae]|uniref:transposase n=1 Tax=Streptomyces cellulosae TaxID=1968 RepID=UPI0036BA2F3D
MPERYGPWKTVYERFRYWSADGTWDRLLANVQQHCDAVGAVDWQIVTPPPCGPTSMRRGPKRGLWPGEAIGRSRGGLTTRIHLACDGHGRLLAFAFALTARNVNDCTQFEALIARIRIARPGPATVQTGAGRRGQGLLVREDPRLPAQAMHQGGHPGTDRPDQRPYPAR